MKKVARRRGLPLKLKEKRQTHTTIEDLYAQGSPLVPARPDPPAPLPPLPCTPPIQSHPPLLPIHMWVTHSDLGLEEEGFRPERALETRSEPCPVREEIAEGRGPPSREGETSKTKDPIMTDTDEPLQVRHLALLRREKRSNAMTLNITPQAETETP